MMRIGIDGRTILPQRTGIGEYAERVVRQLLKYDKINHYYLFLAEPLDYLNAPNLTKVVRKNSHKMGRNRIWENFILPVFLSRHNVQIYFSPAFTLPALPRIGKYVRWLPLPRSLEYVFNVRNRVKYIVTIHDVIACLFPKFFTLKMRIWTKIFIVNAVKIADRILTDSNSTKNDLKNLFPQNEINAVTVYPSLDEKYHPINNRATLDKTRKELGLPEEYILYVGTIEPRKNVTSIARAYTLLPENIQKRYKLVISGGLGWYSESIVEEIKALRTSGEIKMIGYTPHDLLPALYNMASLFVFPSFYEGFGLPPLEAMACGVPVITSGNSSLIEVIGDAGSIIEPNNIEQISSEMQKLLENKTLRESLILKGFERAKIFTPEATASYILRVFEELKQESNNR